MIEGTGEIIDYYRKKYYPLTVIVPDSLNALYDLTDQANLGSNMYYFFSMLRDKRLTPS